MQVNLSYDSEAIKQLIADDIERKLGVNVSHDNLSILVRSKQNYREHQYERGDLKCDLDIQV